MAVKYLNEGCQFSCNCAAGTNRFFAAENRALGIQINGHVALTNHAVLFPAVSGAATMCTRQPNPAGTPPFLPCTLSKVTWSGASKNIGGGCRLLTEDARAVCSTFLGELSASGTFGITCVQKKHIAERESQTDE